jgi:hypothetical protein
VILPIANAYGNYEIATGIPDGYVHVQRKRLQPLCRRLGIEYIDAVTSIGGNQRYGYHPVKHGFIVRAEDAGRIEAALNPDPGQVPTDALITRAVRSWKIREAKLGLQLGQPAGVIEQHRAETFVVLRVGEAIVAEYRVNVGKLAFVEPGPAATLRQQALDRAAIDEIPRLDDNEVVARALLAMHALNRLAKHLRGVGESNRGIYVLKDEFLLEMVLSGRATVGRFQHHGPTNEVYCTDCDRSWYGDTYCNACDDDTGEPVCRDSTWYLVDCGGIYRFHQPKVDPQVAAVSREIPAHDPNQPVREIPRVGLGRVGQQAYVREATRRLREQRGLRSARAAAVEQEAPTSTSG